jgi:hypothetical protein
MCRKWWFALRPNRFTCEAYPKGVPKSVRAGGSCKFYREVHGQERRTGRPAS